MRAKALRRALVAATGAALLVVMCPPAQAYADTTDDPLVGTVEQSLPGVATSCVPTVRWDPIWHEPLPVIEGSTLWYYEEAGATATLSCAAPVVLKVRLVDSSAPPNLTYFGPTATAKCTCDRISLTSTNKVPYRSASGAVARPYGLITVHSELWRSGGVRLGCMEWDYLWSPDTQQHTTTRAEACPAEPVFLAMDAVA